MRLLVGTLLLALARASEPPPPPPPPKPERRPSGVSDLNMDLISSVDVPPGPVTLSGGRPRSSSRSGGDLSQGVRFQRSYSMNFPLHFQVSESPLVNKPTRDALPHGGVGGGDDSPPVVRSSRTASLAASSSQGSSKSENVPNRSTDSFDDIQVPKEYLRRGGSSSQFVGGLTEEDEKAYFTERAQSPYMHYPGHLKSYTPTSELGGGFSAALALSQKKNVLKESLEALKRIDLPERDNAETIKKCAEHFSESLFSAARALTEETEIEDGALMTLPVETCDCLLSIENIVFDDKTTLVASVMLSSISPEYQGARPSSAFRQPSDVSGLLRSPAQSIRKSVSGTPVSVPARPGVGLTVSLGVVLSLNASRFYWYLFQKELRKKLLDAIIMREAPLAVTKEHWWGPKLGPKEVPKPGEPAENYYIVSQEMDKAVIGLLDKGEKVLFIARDYSFYSFVFYRPAGSRILERIRKLDAAIQDHCIMIYNLRLGFHVEQYKTALNISRLASSPFLVLASMMPEEDFAPSFEVSMNGRADRVKAPILWSTSAPAIVVSRILLGIVKPDEMRLSDCLLFQIAIKAGLPAGTDVTEPLEQDPRTIMPDMPRYVFTQNLHCLANTNEADFVALPMIAYHFVTSPVRVRIEFRHTAFLFDLLVNNLNTKALDRAARLRAATSLVAPSWWTEFRKSPLVVGSLFPEFLPRNALFREILTAPFSLGHVAKFRALEASGFMESEEARIRDARIMINVLEWLVLSIENDGDWLTVESWIWVTNLYGMQFNEALGKPKGPETLSVATRISQIVEVAAILIFSSSDAAAIDVAEDVEKVMPVGGPYTPERLSECATASNPTGSLKLASEILRRMAAAL